MGYLKNKKTRWIVWLLVVILGSIAFHQINGFIAGVQQRKAMMAPAVVQTISPAKKEIYASSQASGRIDAKYSVDVVARINGWLEKRYFDEGAKIKKGQTLFLIEPNQYQIAVNNAAAVVRQNQATLINAQKELERAQELVKQDYVSKSYYDDALSLRDRSRAALDAAKAQLSDAQLNLSYTKVTSPIDGKIGKIIITEGNLVNTSSGPLAKIVSVSPIFVYFSLKSSEFLQLKKLDDSSAYSNMEVKIQLSDGSIYNETGVIEFVDNQVDVTTGTITVRATFENKDELLVPGDFVKVLVTSKTPKTVLLVPQSAVLDDADGYYVWKITDENKAVRQNIKVSNEIDKNWIIEEGLDENDVIIGKGIQNIRRDGQQVKPEPLENTSEDTNNQSDSDNTENK